MTENDLLAHPSLLRQEIKQLRQEIQRLLTFLPEQAALNVTIEEWAARIIAHKFCPLNGTGCACACPGTCLIEALRIIDLLKTNGFFLKRLEVNPPNS